MQVWCEDELVGHLHVTYSGASRVWIQRMRAPALPIWGSFDETALVEPVSDKLELPVAERHLLVSGADLGDIARSGKAHFDHLLEYHRVDKQLANVEEGPSGRVFTWPVVSLEQDVLEQVFDLDEFEPV